MVDGWLIDVPEELVDALLLDQICLVGGAGRHLCGVSQARRRQEQRNRFHPRACFAKGSDETARKLLYIPWFERYEKFEGPRLEKPMK